VEQKIISGENKEVVVDCLGCAVQKGEVEIIGGIIAETDHFLVAQDFEIPIPSFLILFSKRHLISLADFSEAEKKDFTEFLVKVREAMRDSLGIDKVTLVQEEKSTHHFHVWLFPWYKWMEEVGKDLSSVRKIMEYARENLKTEANLKKVREDIGKIKAYLKQG